MSKPLEHSGSSAEFEAFLRCVYLKGQFLPMGHKRGSEQRTSWDFSFPVLIRSSRVNVMMLQEEV